MTNDSAGQESSDDDAKLQAVLTSPLLSDKAIAMFLERLSALSPYHWRRVGLRRKDTKVYAKAVADVESSKKMLADRSAVWNQKRSEAIRIVKKCAPNENVFEGRGIIRGPDELADAAADAVGALVILYPWGDSFYRLYAPFSDVIPLSTLDPKPPPQADSAVTKDVTVLDPSSSASTASKAPASAVRQAVDYGRAAGFFVGEAFVVAIWLFVGLQAASYMGLVGLIIGGLPAAAAFFALKASRGPIASINIIQYQRRLVRLKKSDAATYEFVQRWRGIVSTVGWFLVFVELVLILGLVATARR